jgi:K+-sensing histidine kinase KdpD
VILPFLVALALVPFRTGLTHTNAALILVVVVVAVAALGSRTAGAVGALSAAAWFDFFLTRPYQTFDITASADVQTAVLLFVVGVIVSQLAAHARRVQVMTVTDAAHLARIHRTAELAQSAGSADTVVYHVRRELTGLLGLRACRFEYGMLMGRPPRLQQDGSMTVGRCPGTWTPRAGPKATSSYGRTATATTSAASCSLPVRAPYLRSRPVWSP